MKWIGNRISFLDEPLKTTFIIYPESKSWVRAAMGAWVAMWLTIGLVVIWSLNMLNLTQQEKIILYVFLTLWFYYLYRVGKSFFWLLWGKELIKIDETAFTYKKSIRSYGKAGVFYFENIKDMKIVIPKENSIQAVWESSPWIKGGERIEFEYMGKMIRFGQKLKETDAKLLYNVVTKRIQERMKKLR